MANLKYSCFCCSLKTGVLIIAIIGGIFSLLRVVSAIAAFILLQINSWRATNYYSYDDYMSHRSRKDVYYYFHLSMFPISVKIVHSLISLTANILLITAVVKKNRYYLLPWMVISMLDNILISLAVVVGLGMMMYLIDIRIDFKEIMWIFILILSLLCALWWYMWMIVHSYYNELRLNPRVPVENLVKESNSPPPPYLKDAQTISYPLSFADGQTNSFPSYLKDEESLV